MGDCNGNGVCDAFTGSCVCNAGWKFADCSVEVMDFAQSGAKSFETTGSGWASI